MGASDYTQNIVSGLWQKFKQGDYNLLGEIFQNQYNELFYYGLKIIPMSELVKDTIQDIFVGIWARRQKMKEINNLRTYLFISLRRELIRRAEKLREERLTATISEPFTFSAEDFMVLEENSSEASRQLMQSIGKVTERQREVILLRFSHELEFQEIAMIMEMNVQSVRNLLFRALEKIRNDLKDKGFREAGNIELFLFRIFQKRNMEIFSE